MSKNAHSAECPGSAPPALWTNPVRDARVSVSCGVVTARMGCVKYDTAVGRLRQVASDLAGHASWGESVLGGDSGAPVFLLNDAHGVLSGCIGTGDHNDDWIDPAIDYPLRDLSLHLLKKKKP